MRSKGRASARGAPLLLIVAVLCAFGGVVGHEFVNWDDDKNVYENPHLNPVRLTSLHEFWRAPYFEMYIPVTRTVWAGLALLEQAVFRDDAGSRMDPRLFHAANLLIHIANALLVFTILRLLTGRVWEACAGAGLFALHPVQVEPVAWVTGLKDLLGAFWALLAAWLYLRFTVGTGVVTIDPEPGHRKPHRATLGTRDRFAALAVFALALLSKPTTSVIPFLLLWLDVWILRRSWRASSRDLVPWFVLALASVVVNAAVQPAPGFHVSLWQRAVVASDAFVFYLGKILVPLEFAIDYGRTPDRVVQQITSRWLVLIPLAFSALAWILRKRAPWVGGCLGIFVLGLLPVLGLVPFGHQVVSTVADRYLYMAMLGPAMAVAAFLSAVRRRQAVWAVIALLVALGVRSAVQQSRWESGKTLFRHSLLVNPKSRVARHNLGIVYAAEGRYDVAVEEFQELVDQNPEDAQAHYALGKVLHLLGKSETSMSHYRRACDLDPENPELLVDMAQAHALRQEFGTALQFYRSALRLRPNDALTHYGFGTTLAASGNLEDAIVHFSEALRLDPNLEMARRNLNRARAQLSSPAQP